MKLLQTIDWKMRKFNLSIKLLNLYINGPYEQWGIEILKISKGLYSYSLFKFLFFLPNYTNRFRFRWEGDLLFLRHNFSNRLEQLDDHKLWSPRTFTKIHKLKYNILKFILR
jgi:hypothetical protein